jgi:catalase
VAGGRGGGGRPAPPPRPAARSVEFDALLLAGCPQPADDAHGARDAKAGEPGPGTIADPRVLLLLNEAYRHAKPLGGWATVPEVWDAAGAPATAPGVILGEDPAAVLSEVTGLLRHHRVWERFPADA